MFMCIDLYLSYYLCSRMSCCVSLFFFFFKHKTAYEMRISDWSSDVCSSDLQADDRREHRPPHEELEKAHVRGCPCQRSPVTCRRARPPQIGRASCRERVCQYVSISVVAVSLKKKKKRQKNQHDNTAITKNDSK